MADLDAAALDALLGPVCPECNGMGEIEWMDATPDLRDHVRRCDACATTGLAKPQDAVAALIAEVRALRERADREAELADRLGAVLVVSWDGNPHRAPCSCPRCDVLAAWRAARTPAPIALPDPRRPVEMALDFARRLRETPAPTDKEANRG